jgi:hypothetical protein
MRSPANENEGPERRRWEIAVDAVGVLALMVGVALAVGAMLIHALG